jgi:hypothetical protein
LFLNVECFTCKSFYCVNCNEPAHKDRTCEDIQAEKARLQDPLVRAERAMTMAVARECPSCKTPFVKFDGCNKIKCSCGVMSCYVCRTQVQDYNHFCGHMITPCPCRKPCKLWTNTQELNSHDETLRRQAGEKVLREEGFSADRIRRYMMALDGTKEVIVVKQTVPLRPQDRENAAAVDQQRLQIPIPMDHVEIPPQPLNVDRLDNDDEQGQGVVRQQPAVYQYCLIQ